MYLFMVGRLSRPTLRSRGASWFLAFGIAAVLPLAGSPAQADDSVGNLQIQARQALAANDLAKAESLIAQAIEKAPDDPRPRLIRAEILEQAGKFNAAADEYTRLLEFDGWADADKARADLHHRRGSARLFAEQPAAAVKDFDREIQIVPARADGHWQRGIALYYTQRFAEGAKQFEAYQAVDTNDVENSVWWYICRKQEVGEEAARGGLLPIGRDPRVPLMTVYELFREKAKPADVLAAANEATVDPLEQKRRLFYAHLYLGLWHEAQGELEKSLEHMRRAALDHNIGGYMWQVADLHRRLRDPERNRTDVEKGPLR